MINKINLILSVIVIFTLLSFTTFAQKNWQTLPGSATDIGAGADGSIWITGTNNNEEGGAIYKWDEKNWKWTNRGGVALNISVDSEGIPWIVNIKNEIFRLKGSSWQKLPGLAKDIGVGADGSVWIIGSGDAGKDASVYKWNESDWEWVKMSGEGARIAVDPEGKPWLVNNNGNIYRKKGTTWQQLPGLGTDISIGADGSIWIIGEDAEEVEKPIYKWDEKNWKWSQVNGTAVRITVDTKGIPYVVNAKNMILFRR